MNRLGKILTWWTASQLLGCAALWAQGTTFSESALPILSIETQLGLPIVDGFLRESDLYIFDSPNTLNRLSDTPEALPGKIYIEFRGSSSLTYPKKNYGFEIRDSASQAEVKVPLFEMPAHDDWALHGPYADKTLMRNALVYGWARDMTDWAPRTKFVELVVNGSYEGIYLLTEKVRQDNDRVDIARLSSTDTEAIDLTGGYILQVGIDPENEFRSFFSTYSQVFPGQVYSQFRLDYPKYDTITPVQWDYIRDYVHDIEERLAQPDYANPVDGYRNHIDVASWVDHAIVQELTGNFDGFRRSLYLQKDRDDRGGRFAAGPVWDFNIALGNEESCLGQEVAGWMMQSNGPACDFRSLPFFVQQIFADPMFKARMRARWEGLRQNTLSDTRLMADIDSLAALLMPLQQQDQDRWMHMGTHVWPNAYVGATYAEEVAYLRDWLQRRVAWIDQEIARWPRVQTFQPRSSSLPVMRVDVTGGDTVTTGKIDAQLRVINNGPNQVNSPDGASTGYDGAIAIELRGSADEKSHYSFETRDASGEDYDYTLLDLPKEHDWVLLGPYSDKSLAREMLNFQLAQLTGRYAPRYEPVVLYLNDEYEGIYILTEKIKRDADRVDIAKLKPDENSGDDLTGGYILEIDGEMGSNPARGFEGAVTDDSSTEPTFYRYHTPKHDDISPEQQDYISTFVQDVERAIDGLGFSGASDLINANSFIDYLLVNELAANSKAYTSSTFLYKDKDSKDPRLHAGPVWDANRGFGNDAECAGQDVDQWVVEAEGRCGADKVTAPFWRQLWADSSFRQQAVSRWQQLRASAYSDLALETLVDDLTGQLAPEVDANFARYPILGVAVGRNAFVGATYAEEVAYLREWLLDRAEWMDANVATIRATNSTTAASSAHRVSTAPNPTGEAGVLTVRWQSAGLQSDRLRIQITDPLGRVMLDQFVRTAADQTRLDLSALPRGVYQLSLRAGNQRIATQTVVR